MLCSLFANIFFSPPSPGGDQNVTSHYRLCVRREQDPVCLHPSLHCFFHPAPLLPRLPACSGSLCCNGMALAPAVLSGALPRLCISVYLLVLPLVCLLVCPFLHVTLPLRHGRPHRSCPGARLRRDAVGDPRLRQVHTFFIISGNMLCRGNGGALTWSLLGLRFHAGAY